jgi:hypothetical protein
MNGGREITVALCAFSRACTSSHADFSHSVAQVVAGERGGHRRRGRIGRLDTHDVPVASQLSRPRGRLAKDDPHFNRRVDIERLARVKRTPELLMLIVTPSIQPSSPARRQRIGSVRGNLGARIGGRPARKGPRTELSYGRPRAFAHDCESRIPSQLTTCAIAVPGAPTAWERIANWIAAVSTNTDPLLVFEGLLGRPISLPF